MMLENCRERWYKLLIPAQDLEFNDFKNYSIWQEIVIAILNLNSFILSRTAYEVMQKQWGKSKIEIEARNVIFMQDEDYIAKLIRKIC